MKQVIGESMPRSGHHLVHRILTAHLGERFGYCSFYFEWTHDSFKPCCRTIPCENTQTDFDFFLQKSHDLLLSDPLVDGASYLVQVRQPLPRLFSDFELWIRRNPSRANIRDLKSFAVGKATYYTAFWSKRVSTGTHHVMAYESLAADPVGAMSRWYKSLGFEHDPAQLKTAVEVEIGSVDVGGNRYVPKDFTASPLYDSAWAKEYEAGIVDSCPGYMDFFGATR